MRYLGTGVETERFMELIRKGEEVSSSESEKRGLHPKVRNELASYRERFKKLHVEISSVEKDAFSTLRKLKSSNHALSSYAERIEELKALSRMY